MWKGVFMSKKLLRISAVILILLLTSVVLTTCENPAMENVRVQTTYSIRIFPAPQNGTLAVSRERAPGGSVVDVYANPNPGFVLDEDKLVSQSEVFGYTSKIPRKGARYALDVTSYNMSITAAFVPKTSGYTVSIDRSLTHGKIYSYPLLGNPGDDIRLFLLPDPGYDLVPGSLSLDDGTPIPDTVPYSFALPARDVTVSARFEAKDYNALLSAGDKYLEVGEYDTAASFYKEAYKKNQRDPKAMLYAIFAELGDLLIDPDVRSLLGSLGMGVPSTLDDWMCDRDYIGSRWYMTYPGVQYDTAAEGKNPPEYIHTLYSTDDMTLPSLSLRGSEFVTPFGDFNISQAPATTQKFFNILFWSLIYNNRSGLNGFLERVNFHIFGEKFESLAARAAAFPEGATVPLSGRLKERFNLDALYGPGPVEIGAAELNYIFANLWAVKAFIEYLLVYDWTIDLRPWLTTEIYVDDGLDQILRKIFRQSYSNEKHKAYWADPPTYENILPFRNSFLNVRDAKYMGHAKTHFSKALSMANASLSYWYGPSGNFTTDAKDKHQWLKDALAAAKNALDTNGVFYYPKQLPKPAVGAVWPQEAAADYGIDIAKFFSPGAFSPKNIFITELGGRAPSLFKVEWYEDPANNWLPVFTGNYELISKAEPTGRDAVEHNVNGTGNSASYRIYSFGINTAYLKRLFPKGFEQFGDTELMYKVFPSIPLWPTRPTYFMGQGDARELSAARLYYYYHWR
jgi:hypothetical protein